MAALLHMSVITDHGATADTSSTSSQQINSKEDVDVDPASTTTDNGEDHFRPRVYKRRWWILAVFTLTISVENVRFNTWPPLFDAALIAYNWDVSFLTLFPALSLVGFILSVFPVMYLVETRGLRNGMIITTSLITLGTALWCIALPTNQDWLFMVGAFCGGIASATTSSAPTLVSALWFPASERTTATAIVTNGATAGAALSFITGPYISGANVTTYMVENRYSLPSAFVGKLRRGILDVVYFDTALVTICFILVMSYFPDKPPKPPSRSQTKERQDFLPGMKSLLTNPQFWILNGAFNIPASAYNTWSPLYSVSFRGLDVGEASAGWIGFASICGSCVSSILMSLVMDRFKRKIKLFLMVITAVSTLLFVVLVCIEEEYIILHPNAVLPVLYILCISIAICMNGVVPLYYELGVELAYPVHEGLTVAFIVMVGNIGGLINMLLFQVPLLAKYVQWVAWSCLVSCLISLALLVVLREKFHRLDVEKNDSSVDDSSSQPT